MEAGLKIVEILTFTKANRAQVKALEKDIFLLEPCGCMRASEHVCDHVHKCISAWLGPSVRQYRLIYCSRPSERACFCGGVSDGEWVWVTALWQSDESHSLSHSLSESTLKMYV